MNQKIIWPMLAVLGLWILAIISATLPPEKPLPAAIPPAPSITCPAPKPPIITLVPKTENIDYDFYKSSTYLTALSKIQGVIPLQPDMVTQGLRSDHPQIRSQIKWDGVIEKRSNQVCFWPKEIIVDIHLYPKIYIASELDHERCVAEILEHELTHVKIDRKIINEHLDDLYIALKKGIQDIGIIGPIDFDKSNAAAQEASHPLGKIVQTWVDLLMKENHWQQKQLDTMAEYERVSKICRDAQ
jgi:hypothetical protein